ncbi:MAG: helix-turn-helix domain-containing protein [Syntrophales bacterium]
MEKICLVKLRKKIVNPIRSQEEQGIMNQGREQRIPQQFTSSFTNSDFINKAVSHRQGRDEELTRQFIASFAEHDILSKAISDSSGDAGLTNQLSSSFPKSGIMDGAASESKETELGGARQFIAPCADNSVMTYGTAQNVALGADKRTVSGEKVCLKLTQEQIQTIRSSSGLQSIFNGELSGGHAELNYREEPITIKFECEPLAPVRLLMSEEVEQMLRISNGLLKTIVRNGKLKSYKVGKGRRYMLEDILAYLAENLNSHSSQQETLRTETI